MLTKENVCDFVRCSVSTVCTKIARPLSVNERENSSGSSRTRCMGAEKPSKRVTLREHEGDGRALCAPQKVCTNSHSEGEWERGTDQCADTNPTLSNEARCNGCGKKCVNASLGLQGACTRAWAHVCERGAKSQKGINANGKQIAGRLLIACV